MDLRIRDMEMERPVERKSQLERDERFEKKQARELDRQLTKVEGKSGQRRREGERERWKREEGEWRIS